MASVTKADLIKDIADQAGISLVDAEAVLGAFLSAISSSLQDGNKVTVVGFGTFAVAQRAARSGRNPRTKAPITIPAHRTVTFKAGSAFKSSVN